MSLSDKIEDEQPPRQRGAHGFKVEETEFLAARQTSARHYSRNELGRLDEQNEIPCG